MSNRTERTLTQKYSKAIRPTYSAMVAITTCALPWFMAGSTAPVSAEISQEGEGEYRYAYNSDGRWNGEAERTNDDDQDFTYFEPGSEIPYDPPITDPLTPSEVTTTAAEGTIEIDGDPVTVELNGSGQTVELTFDKAAGQRIALRMTNVTIEPEYSCAVHVEGTTWGNTCQEAVILAWRFDEVQEVSGTIPLRIGWAQGSDLPPIGEVTLELIDVPADEVEGPNLNEGPISMTLQKVGQLPTSTFTAVEGQHIEVALSDADLPCRVVIEAPSTAAWSFPCDSSGGSIGPLQWSGEYRLRIEPPFPSHDAGPGSITVGLTTPQPQFIHHNIYGNVMHEGHSSALRELQDATNAYGLPFAFSLNEVCEGQADIFREWILDEHGIDYSLEYFEHTNNPDMICGLDEGTSADFEPGSYGLALLTIGSGHEGSAFVSPYLENPGEERGMICMSAGLSSAIGYACTTHLQGGSQDCEDEPTPPTTTTSIQFPDCDNSDTYYPKFTQFAEYYNTVTWFRNIEELPFHFAGDFYIAAEDLIGYGGFTWEDNVPSDPWNLATHWGRYDSEEFPPPYQADHVIHEADQARHHDAAIIPTDVGDLRRMGADEGDCLESRDDDGNGYLHGGDFCSDHSLIVSYVDFERS